MVKPFRKAFYLRIKPTKCAFSLIQQLIAIFGIYPKEIIRRNESDQDAPTDTFTLSLFIMLENWQSQMFSDRESVKQTLER